MKQPEILPNNPWVYIFKTKSWKILYIWKAKNLKNRISQYFQSWSIWKQDMLLKADNLEFMITESENEALILETNLINKHRPQYNSLILWENSYIYIKITNENFPQITFTRYRKNDWAIYIWPKYYKHDLKKLLQLLMKNMLRFLFLKL